MPDSASMPTDGERRQLVAVKGIRNGLLFSIADDAAFAEVYSELQVTLQGHGRKSGAKGAVCAYVDFGERVLSEEEDLAVRSLFADLGSLSLGGLGGAPDRRGFLPREPYVYKGTVRSGQILEHDGDIVIIGDVNPGAQLIASGDVYVMGYLRGSAHAGARGDEKAIIAATYFDPLQVRIASVLRRSPGALTSPAEMEFAYLDGEQMAVDRMSVLGQYRARLHTTRAVL